MRRFIGRLTIGPMIHVLSYLPYLTKMRFGQLNSKYANSIDANGNVNVGLAQQKMVWDDQILTLRFRKDTCTLYQM